MQTRHGKYLLYSPAVFVAFILFIYLGGMPARCYCRQFTNTTETGKSKSDTSRINKILRKAYSYRETVPDSAAILYREALQKSTASKYRDGIAEALVGIGRYYNVRNNLEKATIFLRQALPYCGNDTRGRDLAANCLVLMSESFYYAGRYDSCAWYRYKALNLVGSTPAISPAVQLRVYSKILQFWMNAHEDVKNDPYIKDIMDRIEKLETKANISRDSTLLVSVYFQKAAYYHNLGKNDTARYYGRKNIELGKSLHVIPSMIMASYINIAITYIDDKQPEAAILNINKAKAEAPDQARGNNRYLAFADIFLGEAYLLQHKYSMAIEVTRPALALANELKVITITDHAHKTLADAYNATGQYQQAAAHYLKYASIRDSLMKTEKMDLVYNVEIKSRIADKNREIAQQELQLTKTQARIRAKNLAIGGTSIGLVLISLLTALLYWNNRNKQRLQSEKINSMQQSMKIDQLTAMIRGEEKERSRIARELHDGMGGTLATVRLRMSSIVRKHHDINTDADFKNVLSLLEEASADLRTSAHNLMPEILLQEGLQNAVGMFCDRLSRGNTLQVTFEPVGELPELDKEFSLVVYRIIQELLNNVVKHAHATQALVQLQYHDKRLSITIEDDGVGFKPAKSGTGHGLKNLAERVTSLNGQVDINSSFDTGTSIYIEFADVPVVT